MADILALGDCNTLGIGDLRYATYAERFAKRCGMSVRNCGFTMSSTREMLHFVDDFLTDEVQIVTVQYGLVDAWKTFKYAPYVLYYPDNAMRKVLRKLVKKYKKTARRLGLNRLLGEKPVVDDATYERHMRYVIEKARGRFVFLIDTVPTQDTKRNATIIRYNRILAALAKEYANVSHIELYDTFADHPEYYIEGTHIDANGYDIIADKLFARYRAVTQTSEVCP